MYAAGTPQYSDVRTGASPSAPSSVHLPAACRFVPIRPQHSIALMSLCGGMRLLTGLLTTQCWQLLVTLKNKTGEARCLATSLTTH